MDDQVIEGWTCRDIHGHRYATDGHTSYKLDESGLSVATAPGWFPATIPIAVLTWLVAQLVKP